MTSGSAISLGIAVDGEESFKSALTAINAQIKALGAGVEAAAASMGTLGSDEESAAKKTELLGKTIEANKQKLEILSKQYEAAQAKLQELAKAMEEAQKSGDPQAIEKATNAYNKQAGVVADLSTKMSKTETEISKASKAMEAGGEAAEEEGEGLEEAGEKSDDLSEKISKMSKIMTTEFVAKAAKAVISALKEIGKAAIDAGKTIVSSYADYEQLTGGVETLFKGSSKTVMQYANEAYKAAGMSANEYMETVTGFSASLISSLGGDTEKAAQYANRAIVDMSDNANKMGTDMQSIQNAYQGFAKQNYNMLDNLKLGYGGTKEEMARLIADASKMTDVQRQLGITVDESSMSFDNIVNAISVMQQSMGIAGTTAKEASATISGSIGMLSTSFQNLVTGLGDANADIGTLVNNVIESFTTMLTNVTP
ncbi:MAG: phage tail protein, partial [Victivallales bacterium]|nr:phage tail protein [Victivallales bacterium]